MKRPKFSQQTRGWPRAQGQLGLIKRWQSGAPRHASLKACTHAFLQPSPCPSGQGPRCLWMSHRTSSAFRAERSFRSSSSSSSSSSSASRALPAQDPPMEKALSMFSDDFGSFMLPHSEPLAFPGKCWVLRGGKGHRWGTSASGRCRACCGHPPVTCGGQDRPGHQDRCGYNKGGPLGP